MHNKFEKLSSQQELFQVQWSALTGAASELFLALKEVWTETEGAQKPLSNSTERSYVG